jgi:flagellar biosynthesis protein FlhG
MSPLARRQAQFWVFVSGKGGVGKSVLLFHLGAALAQQKKRVLLLDADLGLANLHILANVEPRGRLERVLVRAEELSGAVTPLATGCDLLASENGQHLCLLPGHEATSALADTLGALMTAYDYILVDTPRGLSEAGLQFCRACDLSVLVTSDEPTAITNTYAWYKLATLAGAPLPVAIVANATSDASIESRFGALCRRFLGHAPAWGGILPPDPAVALAVARQETVFKRAPESPFWRAVPPLAARLQAITQQSVKTDDPVPTGRPLGPGQP